MFRVVNLPLRFVLAVQNGQEGNVILHHPWKMIADVLRPLDAAKQRGDFPVVFFRMQRHRRQSGFDFQSLRNTSTLNLP